LGAHQAAPACRGAGAQAAAQDALPPRALHPAGALRRGRWARDAAHRGSGLHALAPVRAGEPARAATLQAREAGSGALVADRLRVAETHWTRLKGLLGTASLETGEGLWSRPGARFHRR